MDTITSQIQRLEETKNKLKLDVDMEEMETHRPLAPARVTEQTETRSSHLCPSPEGTRFSLTGSDTITEEVSFD